MKASFFISLFFITLLSSSEIYSQTIKSRDITVSIDNKERPSMSLFSDGKIKPLENAWREYLKKNYNIKTTENQDIVTANGINISTISSLQFNLTARFRPSSIGGCEMIVAAAPGYDIYFSNTKYPEDYQRLKSFVTDFMKSYIADNYYSLKKEKQKTVAKRIKEEEQIHKEINKLEESVKKDTQDINTKQQRIEKSSTIIQTNKEKLRSISAQTDDEL
jgi:hypothetical protein